jgi:hypothetical protein
MRPGAVISMDEARAEQCDVEVQAVLDKHQCNLVSEQRVVNGICMETRIYSVCRKQNRMQ